jgi:hypothetical protein
MWDLWLTKWYWGKFSAVTSVSIGNRSTGCSTLVIIYHPRLVQ